MSERFSRLGIRQADHTRVKQRNHNACREQVPCAVKPDLCRLNMDAQDAQDNQDATLLHKRLTPAMVAYGFADVQDCKPAVSRKKSCASCASM